MGAPMSSHEVHEPADMFLKETDGVAISFWIISIAMIASTVFFLAESATVSGHWKTSMNCGALVTLVAGVHYMYMREYWIQVHASPLVYRYIDWTITVPLQMIEFNLINKAAGVSSGPAGFWKLLVGTVVMLAFGFAGESGAMNKYAGFAVGMFGWFFIVYEIFAGGSAADVSAARPAVKEAFNNMRLIVSVGWAIYPLGYALGNFTSFGDAATLNVVYNIADLVNKIGFVLSVWSCAKSETAETKEALLA